MCREIGCLTSGGERGVTAALHRVKPSLAMICFYFLSFLFDEDMGEVEARYRSRQCQCKSYKTRAKDS